jgi:hypothetical protein
MAEAIKTHHSSDDKAYLIREVTRMENPTAYFELLENSKVQCTAEGRSVTYDQKTDDQNLNKPNNGSIQNAKPVSSNPSNSSTQNNSDKHEEPSTKPVGSKPDQSPSKPQEPPNNGSIQNAKPFSPNPSNSLTQNDSLPNNKIDFNDDTWNPEEPPNNNSIQNAMPISSNPSYSSTQNDSLSKNKIDFNEDTWNFEEQHTSDDQACLIRKVTRMQIPTAHFELLENPKVQCTAEGRFDNKTDDQNLNKPNIGSIQNAKPISSNSSCT